MYSSIISYMPEVKPAIESIAKIKVVGVGGSGGSAVNRMIQQKIKGVEFITMNTDLQSLHTSLASTKVHIGKSATRGLGAGMNPEIGKKAAEENQNEIREALKGANMIFITCGLGGGTGSGAGPVVAEIAKSSGALTVAVVTKPFGFEGVKRKEIADAAFEDLSSRVDTIISIPNDRILQVIDKKASLIDSFRIVDDVLRQGVQGISDLITTPGLINVDFADVETIMRDTGSALMGIGRATGETRAIEAAKMAVDSPLLELSINGARGILITIAGSEQLGMHEVSEAVQMVTANADENAKVIFGVIIDENLKDEVKVTVIATGFDKRDKTTTYGAASGTLIKSNVVGGLKGLNTFGTASAASSSPFSRVEKHEKKEDKIDRSTVGLGNQFQKKTVARVSEPDVAAEALLDEDEIEIPAFIRKKLGR